MIWTDGEVNKVDDDESIVDDDRDKNDECQCL
jgi:hypothetical protein